MHRKILYSLFSILFSLFPPHPTPSLSHTPMAAPMAAPHTPHTPMAADGGRWRPHTIKTFRQEFKINP